MPLSPKEDTGWCFTVTPLSLNKRRLLCRRVVERGWALSEAAAVDGHEAFDKRLPGQAPFWSMKPTQ
jgi:hypothetical protein